ncbi:translocation/assembly module TamB domain-containing protein [Roseivirga pacifica]|uniref:translocation/assembly module TamB domain-containing protein n=2 Tax=Roseivirga pacifica TaxID=1267423 RepID=UPI002095A641|nr:translocation/assembly module TamB domain-containing protein [Roseivirga pacifica]MCO6365873.1 hypothetical protein [Roseivirga pacifica]MCO6375628.1 hypothetical protein [Roseivirga pacifica]
MKIKKSQVIKKRIVKSILWLVLTPFILLGLAVGLIHLPPIQNYITDKATNYLTEGTGYNTEIDYINIRWFNSITVEGARIFDQNDITMIGIEEVAVTFDLRTILGKKDIKTKEAWVRNADVNLRNNGDNGLNIDDWARKITSLTASGDTTANTAAFVIDKITLLESSFSIADTRKDSVKTGFNYNQFQLLDINADLLNLKSVQDTFEIDVVSLSTRDSVTGLQIDKMETFFRNSSKGLTFMDLDLQMGKTRIRDHIEFRHDKPSYMSSFVDSVDVKADFNETVIHTDELSYFVPEFKKYNQAVGINGLFEGKVNGFMSDKFEISLGKNTKLRGAMDIEGLPNVDATFFDLNFENSELKATDIQNLIGTRSFQISDKFGQVYFNGQFDGLVNDFVADGDFRTSIGNISSNVQIRETEDIPEYRGELSMQNFDLGFFIDEPMFQKVDLNGSISGEGVTLEETRFNLVANIPKIGINGYQYINIDTDGAFAQSFFSGEISVSDPNFDLFANGSIDLRDTSKMINITGTLAKAYLDSIKLAKRPMQLSTDFNVDIEGLKIENLIGEAFLSNTLFKYEGRDLTMDSLRFISQKTDDNRFVELKSDPIDLTLDGKFQYGSLIKEWQNIGQQYELLLSSQLDASNLFSKGEGRPTEQFDLSYQLDLKNISPIIHLFDSTIFVAENSSINGKFSRSNTEDFTINAQSEEVRIKNVRLLGNEIDIDAKAMRNNEKVFMLGYLFSEKQYYGDKTETENLTVEAVWDGTHIDFRQNINQESSGNYAEIGADIDFFTGRTELRFEDSNIMALQEEWRVLEDNMIVFGKDGIEIENFKLFNLDQSLSLEGQIAVVKDSSKALNINFKDVEVANINPLTTKEYSGTLNGNLTAQNILFNPVFYGDLTMTELRVNNFLVGDLAGNLNWNDQENKFGVNFEIDRLDRKIISLDGDFYPLEQEQLDLNLRLDEANLRIAEPYVDEYFSELGGFINGQYKITGRIDEPLIEGEGQINEGKIKINYLNTKYDFMGGVKFSQDRIELNNLDFTDINNQKAYFSGVISHNRYKDIRMDLRGNLQQFRVLNTDETTGEDYYGTGVATGSVELVGEASSLNINANIRTEAGSRIHIPIKDSDTAAENPEYITFINRTDTAEVVNQSEYVGEIVEKIKIEGLKLDLDIEVTPDAYAEIIIDPRTGDIIRGRGNGQLRLQIDQQGNFQMTGDLAIQDGAYNFSLYNIITKEFIIEQPSNITWFGDPYTAVMSIRGSYTDNVSITPILQTSNNSQVEDGGSGSSNSGRRFPVKVLLNLEGPLLSPQISFDIDFSEINTQDTESLTAITAFENRLQSDEQELNRQVLSLIILGRFMDQGSINLVGGTTSQSVSQLLSNQLSQFVAQLDENLEVDFDLSGLSEETLNTMRLRLSYTFLNGRLRITREGALTNLVNVESAIGDWTAEYLLTEDGKYRVKIYTRNSYNFASTAISTDSDFTTGASVTQTTSFNTLKELFSGIEKRKKDENEEEPEKNLNNQKPNLR